MTPAVYSVRVSGEIAKRGDRWGAQWGARRRAGIAFGAKPTLVSTTAAAGVQVVDPEQLEEILADPHLRVTEVAPPAANEPAASTGTDDDRNDVDLDGESEEAEAASSGEGELAEGSEEVLPQVPPAAARPVHRSSASRRARGR